MRSKHRPLGAAVLCVLKRADGASTGSGADSSIFTTARARCCTAWTGWRPMRCRT